MPRKARAKVVPKQIENQEIILSDQIHGFQEVQVVGQQEEDSRAVEYIVLQEQGDVEGQQVVVQQGEIPIVQHIQQPQEQEVVDHEEVLKSYYTTHANTLGDTWYICKKCPAFKTNHNSTLRDHINVEHMKISLKCTHCDFESLRFKTLNSHRKQFHGLNAFSCWIEKCGFKSILTPRMIDHVMKKHNFSRVDATQNVDALVAGTPSKQTTRKRKATYAKATIGAKKGFNLAAQGSGGNRPQRKTDEERQYKIHYGDDGRPAFFQCLYCDFTSKMSQNIAGHMNAKHLGKQLKCEECSFSTYYPKNLAVHMKKLHGKTGRRCAVPGCKFRALHDDRMNNHLMEKHGGMYDDRKNTIFVDLNAQQGV